MLAVPRRSGFAVAVLLGGLLALSGCSQPVACSAIGWMNRLVVEVSGRDAAAVDLQLCVDAQCAPRDANVGAFGGRVVAEHAATTWTFLAFVYPSTFDVRAFAPSGAELADRTVTPRWISNSRDVCPGPSTATVSVTL
jgi:hypothetical protein